MGPVVVDDEVEVEFRGEFAVESTEELQELLVAVVRQALAEDRSLKKI